MWVISSFLPVIYGKVRAISCVWAKCNNFTSQLQCFLLRLRLKTYMTKKCWWNWDQSKMLCLQSWSRWMFVARKSTVCGWSVAVSVKWRIPVKEGGSKPHWPYVPTSKLQSRRRPFFFYVHVRRGVAVSANGKQYGKQHLRFSQFHTKQVRHRIAMNPNYCLEWFLWYVRSNISPVPYPQP